MSIEQVDNLGRIFLSNIEEEYTLRKQQKIATKWFSDKIISNKKFFILEMPTGTGKSLTSQLLINYYLENINKNAKFNLLTCTKNLQEQYLHEFNYIHNLYGKQNYYCHVFDTTCDMGYVLHKKKEKCQYCPHKEALNSWLSGMVSMSNFHTFALYSLYNDYVFENNKRNVL
jgi:Rad3-related DNA helicase